MYSYHITINVLLRQLQNQERVLKVSSLLGVYNLQSNQNN